MMQVTNNSKIQLAQSMLSSLKSKSKSEVTNDGTQDGRYDTLEIKDGKSGTLVQGLQQLKQAAKESSQKESEASKQLKCMKIAMRLMNGDHITNKDRKYLAENSPELLEHAMLFRRLNDHPKDYDSLTEDEENENTEQSSEAVQQLSESDATSSDSSSTSSEGETEG